MNIPVARLERKRLAELPFCQAQGGLPASGRLRVVALNRFGPCATCGRPCDGSHNSERGPLFCGPECCPACKAEAAP
jgi:hypothetical protein